MSIPLETRENGGIKVDFNVRRVNTTKLTTKREYTAPLSNIHIYYSIALTIGSDNQAVNLDIDTGSADTWVVSPNTKCNSPLPLCSLSGTYDPTKSTTSHALGTPLNITYGDKSGTLADFYLDDIVIAGAKVKQLQFGVANETSSWEGGLLGLGYESLEAETFNFGQKPYVNFPYALKNQGLISSAYFSLYLNSPEANDGAIIFGGSDTSKYTGPLQVAPFTSDTRYSVNLDHFLPDGGSKISGNYDVVLDSGSTIAYLQQETIDLIASNYPEATKTDKGWTVDANSIPKGNLKFSFDGNNYILVPFSALVDGSTLQINPPVDGISILGDNFLRYAYIIFDLDKHQASLAQAKFE